MRSGISKAQPGTDGGSLCRTQRLSHSTTLPASHAVSLFQIKTHQVKSYNFAHSHSEVIFLHVCSHRCTTNILSTGVRHWHTGTIEILQKHTTTSLSLSCCLHFMSLLCISPNTINSGRHTDWHRFTHSLMNSEGAYLLVKVKRNPACYYRWRTMQVYLCVLSASVCVCSGENKKISWYVLPSLLCWAAFALGR